MTDKLKKDIANKFKKAREDAKLTQSEVADKVGMNTNYYAKVERAEASPSMEMLQKLIKVLKIKVL